MTTSKSITVQGTEIHVTSRNAKDYISLTDMTLRFEGGPALIDAWLRNKDTIEFLGVWEKLHTPSFNAEEFDKIRFEAGTNRFRLSVKRWTDVAGGEGIIARTGRYGGTFAHQDIAFEFGSWLSPEFKLYLIREFQRLKEKESELLEWNVRRTLSKVQYRVHTDAIKQHLIPGELSPKDASMIYASEAEVINKAVFGTTSAEWRKRNPGAGGNIRDEATVEQLVVLSSIESQNALLIQQGMPQEQRLMLLNRLARQQLSSLLTNPSLPPLKSGRLL